MLTPVQTLLLLGTIYKTMNPEIVVTVTTECGATPFTFYDPITARRFIDRLNWSAINNMSVKADPAPLMQTIGVR